MSLCQYVLRPRRASARPRRASKRLDCRLWKHATSFINRKGKIVMTKTSRYKGLVLGSFLVPEIDMIFGDGVGASLVRGRYCQLGVGLMRFYIGAAQLKKVLGWA